jgi:hypothetical protein
LAIALAASVLEHFVDGIWFIDLSPVIDPQLVLPVVARVLVIELAADATVLSSLEEYLRDGKRLLVLDNFEQVLAAAIDWSYDLLAPEERTLFRRLGVFVGGCDLDAAAAVAPEVDVLGALGALVTRTLLRVEEEGERPRYRPLETIREYALVRLMDSGEEEPTRRRHAAYLLALVERAEPEQRGPQQSQWLDRLESDHDNLRAALTWSIAHDPETALRLGAGLWRFWFTRGYMLEGQHWLDLALEAGSRVDTSGFARARALTGAGEMAWGRGDLATAAARHTASLELRRELGDLEGVAQALHNLGNAQLGVTVAPTQPRENGVGHRNMNTQPAERPQSIWPRWRRCTRRTIERRSGWLTAYWATEPRRKMSYRRRTSPCGVRSTATTPPAAARVRGC